MCLTLSCIVAVAVSLIFISGFILFSFQDMESADEQNGNGSQEALPPPPPDVPPNVVPVKAEPEPVKKKPLRVPIARRGLGSKGQKMPLLTNHFKVNVTNTEGYFFHYCVRAYISVLCFLDFISILFCIYFNLPDVIQSGFPCL